MNLRPRFILLILALFAISAPLAWLTERSVAERIVAQWAVRYAEKQLQYDKARMQPVFHEVALSRQLAQSPIIRQWAEHPDDPALTRRALAELENYRHFFASRSYFLALRKNRRYYYNNASDEYSGKQFRYRLNPKAKKDAWFFDLVRQDKRVVHININPDPALGVTELWIDVLIRDRGKVLGITGTGLDLTPFIKHSIENATPGISTLFADYQGAIQLYRDQKLIDYASITKRNDEHKTVDLLLQTPANRIAVHAAMRQAKAGSSNVATAFINLQGRRYLVSVAYLPELGWYEINLLDLSVILPYTQFIDIAVVFLVVLLVALTLFYLALGRWVIRPLQALERTIASVEAGLEPATPHAGSGEVGRLVRHFGRMTHALLDANKRLETKVAERTQALERLSKIDPLTELLNRRGMTERIEAELEHCRRADKHLALLWIDVDHFKSVNDRYGHVTGDEALKLVATLIREALRPYDVAARWGGDEFLVMLEHSDVETMDRIGLRLHDCVASGTAKLTLHGERIPLSVSIGGCLALPGESLGDVLTKADQALYVAKSAGRNRYHPFDTAARKTRAP
ncbi:MAG: diguanylate cyclase [Acidihalobacter sp.]